MMLWMSPFFDEVWPVLVDRISALPPIVSNILCAGYQFDLTYLILVKEARKVSCDDDESLVFNESDQ